MEGVSRRLLILSGTPSQQPFGGQFEGKKLEIFFEERRFCI